MAAYRAIIMDMKALVMEGKAAYVVHWCFRYLNLIAGINMMDMFSEEQVMDMVRKYLGSPGAKHLDEGKD